MEKIEVFINVTTNNLSVEITAADEYEVIIS